MNLRQLFVAISMMAILPCFAQQEMSVAGFKLLDKDLSAMRQGTQREDINGNVAALIKIVTIEKGFVFDGGSLGIVHTEYMPGEVWVYVPERAQRLTISHPTFGVLRNYAYPIPIVGGRTYEMLLDIGAGRYVTINASRPGSEIQVDGQHVGNSPLYNYYMTYGNHTVQAQNGRFEGVAEVFISANERKDSVRIIPIEMKDLSHLYGDVLVTVDGRADIYYAGSLVGTGRWRGQLKEGVHEVETRKANCDSVKTQFTVKARQQNNITATPPRPHVGWLSIYTRPRNVSATDNGQPINLTEVQTLTVGTHQIAINRKGYVGKQMEYTIVRDETIRDTVQLERVTYIKPNAIYLGAAYTVCSLSGVTGFLGLVHQRHDLQLSYTFGLDKSSTLYVYDESEQANAMYFTQNSLSIRYGYQFPLLSRFTLTPQLGYSYDVLTGHLTQGSKLSGDGASAQCLTVGLKLQMVPMQHTTIFVAPEYAVALSKTKAYTNISNTADFPVGGFMAHMGILINF